MGKGGCTIWLDLIEKEKIKFRPVFLYRLFLPMNLELGFGSPSLASCESDYPRFGEMISRENANAHING